jgi:ATP-binding cassette subfamily B multidrug efflux pump
MMMHSGLSGSRSGGLEKVQAHNLKDSLKKLFVYLGPHRVALMLAAILAVGSTAANIFGPLLLGRAITLLAQGSPIDLVRIGQLAALTLGLYLLSALLSYVQSWIMAGIATNITYSFRREISEKINRLPLQYFDATPAGEVLSRLTNDVDTVNQTLSQSLTQVIISAVTLIGVLIMMLVINVWMTLIALITIPLSMIAGGLIIRQSQEFFKQQQAYLGQVNGHVEEMYSGHIVVQAFNGEAKSLQKFEIANQLLYVAGWKAQALSGLMMPIMTFIGNLGYVLVTVIGGWLAFQGTIAVGAILAFIQYMRSFTQPVTQLANISNILQQTAAAAERVFEFLAESEEIPDTARPIQLARAAGHVEFRDVHFGYHPQRPIIKAFSYLLNHLGKLPKSESRFTPLRRWSKDFGSLTTKY